MTRTQDMNVKEEKLVRLAAEYLEVTVPKVGGAPIEAKEKRIGEKIRRAFAPGDVRGDVEERVAAARKVLGLMKTGDWKRGEIESELRRVFAPNAEPRVASIEEFCGKPEPEAVIWRDRRDGGDPDAPAHSVLAVGEVAVLSGGGGIGKSHLSLQLAAAAATLDRTEHEALCGLRVRGGGAIVISYEDSAVRIAKRVERMGRRPEEMRLSVVDPPRPLFPVGAAKGRPRDHARAPYWTRLFAAIRKEEPVLVVIDPGPKSMGGLADNMSGPVIAYFDALQREACNGQFGVLVIAHDTKAARGGGDPGPGGVAGSGQWHDSARGVIHLSQDPDNVAEVLLECIKANYGPKGWGSRLGYNIEEGGIFKGLSCLECLDITKMREARGKGPGARKNANGQTRKRRGTREGAEVFAAGEVA